MPNGDPAPLLLPEGTRLLHIGPPKTGTTALQAAFDAGREAVLAQGVRYAGRGRHSASAVLAVLGRPSFQGEGEAPPISRWRDLVLEVRRATEPRVLVSSEFFADGEPDAIRRAVGDLDPGRVHVVATLRPLGRIISSQWQQYVQSGLRLSFDAWLDRMFNRPGSVTPTFWRRHRHDELVARWADVVGRDRVTVVVLDERDHGMVLRVFEGLLGLREGTLVAVPDLANRSMTLPEIEAVRAFNVAYKAAGLGNALLHDVMHFGAAVQMKLREPAPDEPRVETPQWALDRATAIGREIVDAVAASGVRVVGDLESLAAPQASRLAGDRQPAVCVAPEIAAAMAMGVLFPSGSGVDGNRTSTWRPEPPELARVPTARLARVLVDRLRAAAGRSVRRRVEW